MYCSIPETTEDLQALHYSSLFFMLRLWDLPNDFIASATFIALCLVFRFRFVGPFTLFFCDLGLVQDSNCFLDRERAIFDWSA